MAVDSLTAQILIDKQDLFLKLLQRTNWHILNSTPKQQLVNSYAQGFHKDISDWAHKDHKMGNGESVYNNYYQVVGIPGDTQSKIKANIIERILKSLPHVVACAVKCFRVPTSLSSSSVAVTLSNQAVSESALRLENFRAVVFELHRLISTHFLILREHFLDEIGFKDENTFKLLSTSMADFVTSLSDSELKTFEPTFWIDDFLLSSLDGLKRICNSNPMSLVYYGCCLAAIRCLKAPTVDFRLRGASRLSHFLKDLQREMKEEVVCKILECGVLNEVCGERLHIEVLKAMKGVFAVIVNVKKWGQDLTQRLWLASLNRHSAEQLAIFDQLNTVLFAENNGACSMFWDQKCIINSRQFYISSFRDPVASYPRACNALVHRSYLPRIRQMIYLIEATYLPVSFRDSQNPYYNLKFDPTLTTYPQSQITSSSMGELHTTSSLGLFELVPPSVIRYSCHLLSRKCPQEKVVEVIDKLLKDVPGLTGNASSVSRSLVSNMSNLVSSKNKDVWALMTSEELLNVIAQSSAQSSGDLHEDEESHPSSPSTSSEQGISDDEASQWEVSLLGFSTGPECEPLPCPSPRFSRGQGLLSASFRPAVIPFIGLDPQGAAPLPLLRLLDYISNILCRDHEGVISLACLDYSTLSSFIRLTLSLFRSSPCPALETLALPTYAYEFRLNQYSKSALLSASATEFLDRFVEVSLRFSSVFQARAFKSDAHYSERENRLFNDDSELTSDLLICKEMKSIRCFASFHEQVPDARNRHIEGYRQLKAKIESSAPIRSFSQFINLSERGICGSIGIPLEVSGSELVINILTEFAEAEGLLSRSTSPGGTVSQGKHSRLPLIAALFSKFAIAEGVNIQTLFDSTLSGALKGKNQGKVTTEDFAFSNDLHGVDASSTHSGDQHSAPFSSFVALKKPQSCVIEAFESTILGSLHIKSERGSMMIATHTSIALMMILRACLTSLSRKRAPRDEAERFSFQQTINRHDSSWACEADPCAIRLKEKKSTESLEKNSMVDDNAGNAIAEIPRSDQSVEKEGRSRLSIQNLAQWMRLFGLGCSDSLIASLEHEPRTAMQRSLLLFIADGINWTGPIDTSLGVARTLSESDNVSRNSNGFCFTDDCTAIPIEERFLLSTDPLFVSDLWRLLCDQLVSYVPSLCNLDAFGLHALRTAFFVRNLLPSLWKYSPSDDRYSEIIDPPLRMVRGYYFKGAEDMRKTLTVRESGFSSLFGLQTLLCRVILYANSEHVWASAVESLCGLATSFSRSTSRRENSATFSKLLSDVLSLFSVATKSTDGLNRLSKRSKIDLSPSLVQTVQGRLLLSSEDVASMSHSHRAECIRRLIFTQRRLVSEMTEISLAGEDSRGPVLGSCAEFIELLRLSKSHSEEFNAEFGEILIKVQSLEKKESGVLLRSRLSRNVSDATKIKMRVLSTDSVDDIRARIAKSFRVDFSRLTLSQGSTHQNPNVSARKEGEVYVFPDFNNATGDPMNSSDTFVGKSGLQERSSLVLGSELFGYAGEAPLALLPSAGILSIYPTTNPRRKVFLNEDMWGQLRLTALNDDFRSDRTLTRPTVNLSSIPDIATSVLLDRHPNRGAAMNPPLMYPPSETRGSYFDITSWKPLLALVEKDSINSSQNNSNVPKSGSLCGTNPGSSHISTPSSNNIWTSFTSSFEMMNMLLWKLAELPHRGASSTAIASESSRCEIWRLLNASAPSSPLVIAYLARAACDYSKTESLGSLDWTKILSPAERRIETQPDFSRDRFSPCVFDGATLSSCYLLQCVVLLLRPPFEHSPDISNSFSGNGLPDHFPSPFEFSDAFVQSGGLKAICSYLLSPPLSHRREFLNNRSSSEDTVDLDHILPLLLQSACLRILACLLEPVESFDYLQEGGSLTKSAAMVQPDTGSSSTINLIDSKTSLNTDSSEHRQIIQSSSVTDTQMNSIVKAASRAVIDCLSSSEQESLVTLLWKLIAGNQEPSGVVHQSPMVGSKRRERDSEEHESIDDVKSVTGGEDNPLESIKIGRMFRCNLPLLEGNLTAYLHVLVKASTGRMLSDGIRSLEILMDRSSPTHESSVSGDPLAPSFDRCIGIEQISAVCRTLLYDSAHVGANGQRAMLSCLLSLLSNSKNSSRHNEGDVTLGVKVLQASCTVLHELLSSTVDPSSKSADFVIPEMPLHQNLSDYLDSLTAHTFAIASGRLAPSFFVPSTSALPRCLNRKSEIEGIDLDLLLQLVCPAIDSIAKSKQTNAGIQIVRKELFSLLSLFVRAMSSASLMLRPMSAPSQELSDATIEAPSDVVIVDSGEDISDHTVVFPSSPTCPSFLSNLISSLIEIAHRAINTLFSSPLMSLSNDDTSVVIDSKDSLNSTLVYRVYSAVFHHGLFRPERPLLSGVPYIQKKKETQSGKSPREIGWKIANKLALSCYSSSDGIDSSFILGKNAFSVILNAIRDGRRDTSSELADWSSLSSTCGFIGLKNQGATCYQNSLLQQLFFIPAVRHGILSAAPLHTGELEKKLIASKEQRFQEQLITLRSEFQRLFSSMTFGNVGSSYDPLQLVLACDNKPPGFFPLDSPVRSQNDANEFFALLLDRLSKVFPSTFSLPSQSGPTQASSTEGSDVISNIVGGRIVNQMIGRETSTSPDPTVLCSHKKEREEGFLYLQLDVSGNETIEKSLTAYVQGELLTGDNAFQCDECGGRKVETLKRCCIAQVPDTLVLQLKRFKMDWNTMVKEKINDRFVFGHDLDLFPYTATGIAQAEELSLKSSAQIATNVLENADPSIASPLLSDSKKSGLLSQRDCQYVLRGVLVHSGNANSGHYYSYIKPRPSDTDPSAGSGLRAICAQYGNNVRSMPPHIADILEAHKNALSEGSTPSSAESKLESLQTFIDHFTSGVSKAGVSSPQNTTGLSENSYGWFELNDEKVVQFVPSATNTENKWYGGSFVRDNRQYPLATNAFMLFYDRVIPPPVHHIDLPSVTIAKKKINSTLKQISAPLPVLLPLSCAKKALSANQGIFKSLLANEIESHELLNSILVKTVNEYKRTNGSPLPNRNASLSDGYVLSILQQYSTGLLQGLLETTSQVTSSRLKSSQIHDKRVQVIKQNVRSLLTSFGLFAGDSVKSMIAKSPVGFVVAQSQANNDDVSTVLDETRSYNSLTDTPMPTMREAPGGNNEGSVDVFHISLLESCINTICGPARDMWVSVSGKCEIPKFNDSKQPIVIDASIDDDPISVRSDEDMFNEWALNVLIDAPSVTDVQNTSPLLMRTFGDTNSNALRLALRELLPGVVSALCVVAEPLVAPTNIKCMTKHSFDYLNSILPKAQLDPQLTLLRKRLIWKSMKTSFIYEDPSVACGDLNSLLSQYHRGLSNLSGKVKHKDQDETLERQLRALFSLNLLARQLVPFTAVALANPDSDSFSDYFHLIKTLLNIHPLAYFCLLRNHLLEWLLQVVCHVDPKTWNSPRRADFDDFLLDSECQSGTKCLLQLYETPQAPSSNQAPFSPLNSLIGRMDDLKLPSSNPKESRKVVKPHSNSMVLITSVISDLVRGIDLGDLSVDEGDGKARFPFYEPGHSFSRIPSPRDSPFSIFPGAPLLSPPSERIVRKILYQPEIFDSLLHISFSDERSFALREIVDISVAYQHLSFAKPGVSMMLCSALGDLLSVDGRLNPPKLPWESFLSTNFGLSAFELLIGNKELSRDGFGLIRLQSALFSVPDLRFMEPKKNLSVHSNSKTLSNSEDDFTSPRFGYGKMRPVCKNRIPSWVATPSRNTSTTSSAPPSSTCSNVDISALKLMISKGPNAWLSTIDERQAIVVDETSDTPAQSVTCHRFGILSSILDTTFVYLNKQSPGIDVFQPERSLMRMDTDSSLIDSVVIALKIVSVIQKSTSPNLWLAARRLPTFIQNVPTIGDAITFIYDRFGKILEEYRPSEPWSHLFKSARSYDLLDDSRFAPRFLAKYGKASGFLPENYTSGGGRLTTSSSESQRPTQKNISAQVIHGPSVRNTHRQSNHSNASGTSLAGEDYNNGDGDDEEEEEEGDDDGEDEEEDIYGSVDGHNCLEIVFRNAFRRPFLCPFKSCYKKSWENEGLPFGLSTLEIEPNLGTVCFDDDYATEEPLCSSVDELFESTDEASFSSKVDELLDIVLIKLKNLSSSQKRKIFLLHTGFVQEALSSSEGKGATFVKEFDSFLRPILYSPIQGGGKGPLNPMLHSTISPKPVENLKREYPCATLFHLTSMILHLTRSSLNEDQGGNETERVDLQGAECANDGGNQQSEDDEDDHDGGNNSVDDLEVEDELEWGRASESVDIPDDIPVENIEDVYLKKQNSTHFQELVSSLGKRKLKKIIVQYGADIGGDNMDERNAQTQALGPIEETKEEEEDDEEEQEDEEDMGEEEEEQGDDDDGNDNENFAIDDDETENSDSADI